MGFLAETMQARRNISKVREKKKKKRLLTKNTLSAKTVHQKWEVDTFPDKEMLKELTTSRPVLQEIFKVNPSN